MHRKFNASCFTSINSLSVGGFILVKLVRNVTRKSVTAEPLLYLGASAKIKYVCLSHQLYILMMVL